MNDLPKQRPKARNSVSSMARNACTEDKIPVKRIYVGNLSSEITENDVNEYFLKFGSVAFVAIKRTRSKRAFYGFVTFEKSESAAKALRLATHEILNRHVVVKAPKSWSQPKKNDAKCKRNEVPTEEASEMKCSLMHLDDDCFYHIASYLQLLDLLNLSKTCKSLECRLEPAFASHKKLDFESLDGPTLMSIRAILCKIGPYIQHIAISEIFELNGKRFELLLKKYCVAANIVSLDIYYPSCPLSKRLIQTFVNLKTLKCSITDDISAVLSTCSNLQTLDLWCSRDLTGKHLDKLSNLQNLNLAWCENLQPEFFKNLCMKTKLVSLNINGCRLLDYSSIETLASTQTKLESLSISNTYKTSNLSPLATLKNLKRLKIDCCREKCDEFIQELAKHRGAELEVLEIWDCLFNQKATQAICSLKKLKMLAVYCCSNITSMFLTKLDIRSLEFLAIQPLESTLWEDVLNLISKSETINVILANAPRFRDSRPLVRSAYEIIRKKDRKYPLSLFTKGPCIIDGMYHEELEFEVRTEFRKIIKKLGYLAQLPWYDDFDIFLNPAKM